MTKATLQRELNSGRLTMARRDRLVKVVLEHPELIGPLLEFIALEDQEGTFNASWVFDNAVRKGLHPLLPHLDRFTEIIPSLVSESCIRPMAHCCELLVLAYFKTKDDNVRKHMNETHLEVMASTCFDWLIGTHKVAAKVFAMTSLLHLGQAFDWIHAELRPVLEATIAQGTAGYKHRAKKTLDQLHAWGR